MTRRLELRLLRDCRRFSWSSSSWDADRSPVGEGTQPAGLIAGWVPELRLYVAAEVLALEIDAACLSKIDLAARSGSGDVLQAAEKLA